MAVTGQGRTILVVEDEVLVRGVTRRILEASSHRVLIAEDPIHAIELYREAEGVIDLLVTDLSMPRMSGQALARELRALDAKLRILYLSGYTTGDVDLDERSAFLAKPFSREDFLAKARQLLAT